MRIRTILIACAGLVAALVLALVIFLATFDANKYKGLIEAKAHEATGRDLAIKGPIHLSLSPRPTLVVQDLAFANMPGGARPEMVTAQRLEIALDLMPLLSGRVSVASLKLAGADLLLETGRDGRGNWQFATGSQPAAGTAPAAPPADAGRSPATSPLSVRAIQVTDSTVTYRTDATGQEKTLSIGRFVIQPGSGSIPIEAAGALDQVPFELKGVVGSGALVGAPHFPVTLNGRLLGFDLALDGELGQTFKAKITAGDLKPLATALGSTLPEVGAIKIDTTVSGPLSAPVLDPLVVGIGGNDLQGKASLKLGGARPAISANLQSQRIALGVGGKPAVAPAAAGKGEAKPAAKEQKPLFSPAPLPFEALKSVDLDARIEISSLTLGDLALDGVSATVTLANGLLTAKPVAAGIAGGHVTLDATVDAAHQAITLDAIGQQLATDQLLKQLGMTAYVVSKADVSAKLTGHGESAHAIASSLDGNAALTLGPGTIAGKVLQGELGDAAKLVSAAGDATKLSCGVIRLQIAGGVAHPNPLVLETGEAVVNGAGAIDLGRETVDLKLTPRMTNAGLANLAVPFRVAGPLTAPGVQADTAGLAASAAAALAGGGAGIKPLAGLLGGGGGGAAPAASGGCRAPPAAATTPAAGTAPKPASPAPASGAGQLLNNLGRALSPKR